MKYEEFYLQPNWFGGEDPETPKKATATLTFSDSVTKGDTVEIGDEVYEFVEEANDVADEDNIAVVLGTTLTKKNAADKLAKAINDNSVLVSAERDDDKGNELVIVSALEVGDESNDIDVDVDCTNASWGTATALDGGQYGTPCPMRGIIVEGDNNYYFICTKPGTKSSVEWKKFVLVDC